MAEGLPPNHTQIISDVAHRLQVRLNEVHIRGGLRVFGSRTEQLEGNAYMDGARILLQHYRPLMNNSDKVAVLNMYNLATDAREKLPVDSDYASGSGVLRAFVHARAFKRLSKAFYRLDKKAAYRDLDYSLLKAQDVIHPGSKKTADMEENLGGAYGPVPAGGHKRDSERGSRSVKRHASRRTANDIALVVDVQGEAATGPPPIIVSPRNLRVVSDSRSVSTQADVDIGDPNTEEMSAMQPQVIAAVVPELHGRDAFIQQDTNPYPPHMMMSMGNEIRRSDVSVISDGDVLGSYSEFDVESVNEEGSLSMFCVRSVAQHLMDFFWELVPETLSSELPL